MSEYKYVENHPTPSVYGQPGCCQSDDPDLICDRCKEYHGMACNGHIDAHTDADAQAVFNDRQDILPTEMVQNCPPDGHNPFSQPFVFGDQVPESGRGDYLPLPEMDFHTVEDGPSPTKSTFNSFDSFDWGGETRSARTKGLYEDPNADTLMPFQPMEWTDSGAH